MNSESLCFQESTSTSPHWILNSVCDKEHSRLSSLSITVFDVVQSPPLSSPPPCKFGKKLVVDYFVEKKFILKILELEITSKKIFLIFLFIMYDTAIIKKSSSYFFGKFSLSVCFWKLSMKLTLVKSSSSSSFTSDHLKSIAFSSL